MYLGAEKFGYPYHITVTPSKVKEYRKKEKAIEAGDIEYLRSIIKIDKTDKLYIEKFGQGQYTCAMMKYTKEEYPFKKYTGYECYKFNQNKTKYQSVHIRLTYNQPTNSLLKNEYTYEDLQNRAKRVLDSLYIKDGWEK